MPAGRGCGLAYMIGLDRTLCDEYVSILLQGLAEQKLEFAGLVAPAREPGAIIALDVKLWPAKLGAEARHRLDRRRPMTERKAREAA